MPTDKYADEIFEDCSQNVQWDTRTAKIQQVTGGGAALPSWQSFSPSGDARTSAVDCSVQVSSTSSGLAPSGVRCEYSIDGGTAWLEHEDVSCTGSHGSTGWETITANGFDGRIAESCPLRVQGRLFDMPLRPVDSLVEALSLKYQLWCRRIRQPAEPPLQCLLYP